MNFSCLRLLFFMSFMTQITVAQEHYYSLWFSSDSSHLPQNSVKSIIADKYGYIWLSTENGLVRYDGQNFRVFNSENIKGIHSNRMIVYSGKISNDSLFIQNEKYEEILINRRVAKFTGKKFADIPRTVTDFERVPNISMPGLFYSDIGEPFGIEAGEKRFVIGDGRIRTYNNNRKLLSNLAYKHPDSSQFFSLSGKLYLDNKNNTYTAFSAIGGVDVFSYDRSFTTKYRIYTNTPAQQVFVYTHEALYRLIEKNGRIESDLILKGFDLIKNNIVSLYYDEKNEVVYLGSANKGLLVVKKQGFKHASSGYTHSSGTDDVYYALMQYDKNTVLASTGEKFGKNGFKSLVNIGSHTDKYMLTIDDNGDIWTKDCELLYCFSKSSGYKKHRKWDLKYNISTIAKGKDGRIWLGMLNEFNKKGGYIYYIDVSAAQPEPVFFMKNEFGVSALSIDHQNIWAGTWRGLYKIDIKTKKISHIKGIPDIHIRNVYLSKKNEIWVCSYDKGLYLYRNGKVTSFPVDRNGHLLSCHCIVEDNKGYFWITTNKGLFQARKQDLYDYADNKIEKIYYHHYTKNGGFLNNEFNGGCQPCGVYLNQETIFLPSMDGVVYFNPGNLKTRQPENGIYIDEISIDNKIIPAGDTLVIDKKFERIIFFISSPFFGNQYNQNIEMKLEGPVLQDWLPITENNISFSTLPPGHYTLKARKLSGFGSQWIYKDYNFTITPAYWQTTWFMALLATLALLAVFFMVKLRLRYIRYKNTLLEKKIILQTSQLRETITTLRETRDNLNRQVHNHKNLIKNITHDIKSPLKFMAITGRYLYNNLESKESAIKDDIQAIYTSSSQLYHFVDNFLEYTKESDKPFNEPEPYSLYMLVKEKMVFFNNIATSQKTNVANHIPKDIFLTVNRHLLSIIIHNLLDNAIKNTYAGSITFTAEVSNGAAMITITDTGKGMSERQLKYYRELLDNTLAGHEKQGGMGIHIIADLLAIINGKMEISSEKNRGTTITIAFTLTTI